MSISHTRTGSHFSEEHVLETLRHYLPTQGPLKDFVHHNTLHAFQNMKFYDALFKSSQIFGYKVTFSLAEYRDLLAIGRISKEVLERVILESKGKVAFKEWYEKAMFNVYNEDLSARSRRLRYGWRELYPIDLNNAVHPLLFRILCSYLDQGIAITPFPFENTGLLNAIRTLEKNSFAHFFKTERARTFLQDESCTIKTLLKVLVGKEEFYEEYLYSQQFTHRGWSGIVATLEEHPESLLYPKKISLRDMVFLECLLEIDNLDYALGTEWKPLGEMTKLKPMDMFADIENKEIYEVLKIWHNAFEWSYYDQVLSAMTLNASEKKPTEEAVPEFKAVFCIDEREESLRRHIESIANCETLGAPGFFGVEFYFHSDHAKFYEKLCPVPVTAKHLIKEIRRVEHKRGEEIMYTKSSHTLIRGVFASYFLGIPSALKLIGNLLRPKMSPAIADAFGHMEDDAELTILYKGEHDQEKGLQVGYTVQEMTDRVEKLLRGIGMVKDFPRIVYLMGHGSSSANNPHHGAHDCGACSGRPGAVNARVFAHMANYEPVRKLLAERGLIIPVETQFVGGIHDTASDEVEFYDTKILSEENMHAHKKNAKLFEKALDLNAKERSRRFMSINTRRPLQNIRKAIKDRSVSYFEPRPELGHGTNALCIVGNRSFTKDLFLDRRAFMNSYDYRTDPDGKYLANVIAPLPIVCGGINLEYYFSRMDNSKLGAGTKLPHNVMGLIGVANSSDGDLRAGLPLQMIEVHDPVRLLMIIEHSPEVVMKVISASPAILEWFTGEWIHLAVFDPEKKKFFIFKEGAFKPYDSLNKEVKHLKDVVAMLESAIKMKTNNILDATQENLPVQIITK